MGLEPLTLLAALAVVTDRIGLAATLSTTYSAPYAVARAIASLDHLSNGRAGWNVVTSQSNLEARNFGLDLHAGHAERYARAAEYVDVVTRLWDSWEVDTTATSGSNKRRSTSAACTSSAVKASIIRSRARSISVVHRRAGPSSFRPDRRHQDANSQQGICRTRSTGSCLFPA